MKYEWHDADKVVGYSQVSGITYIPIKAKGRVCGWLPCSYCIFTTGVKSCNVTTAAPVPTNYTSARAFAESYLTKRLLE